MIEFALNLCNSKSFSLSSTNSFVVTTVFLNFVKLKMEAYKNSSAATNFQIQRFFVRSMQQMSGILNAHFIVMRMLINQFNASWKHGQRFLRFWKAIFFSYLDARKLSNFI